MSDMRSGAAQDLNLRIVQMHAVREHYIRRRKTNFFQIGDVPFARIAKHDLYLVSVFRSVSVNQHAVFIRKLCNAFKQLTSATDREARSEAASNSAIRLTVPALDQLERFGDR